MAARRAWRFPAHASMASVVRHANALTVGRSWGVPYRSQSLKATEQEQQQSWLFGAGPGRSRTYEGRGRNDDSEPNDATDNSMCVAGVVPYVVAPICVRVALIGHDRLLQRFHCGLREQTPTAIVVTHEPQTGVQRHA